MVRLGFHRLGTAVSTALLGLLLACRMVNPAFDANETENNLDHAEVAEAEGVEAEGVEAEGVEAEGVEAEAESQTGDGDPTTTGDGDPTTTGDGDGDGDPDPTTTGDGDGDPDPTTTGDGDGDPDVPDNAYCNPVSNWDPNWVAWELEVLALVNRPARREATAVRRATSAPRARSRSTPRSPAPRESTPRTWPTTISSATPT
jgi:hypothetical protein